MGTNITSVQLFLPEIAITVPMLFLQDAPSRAAAWAADQISV
jgi:hypothetical protein